MQVFDMNKLTQNIIFNIHPTSLLLSAGSVLAGLAASVERGGVALFPAIMTLLVAVTFQVSANLYYGFKRADKWMAAHREGKDTLNPEGYKVMRPLSNAFGIVAITMAFPLFTRMGWLAMAYLAVLVAVVYLYFGGPRPLVRTRWGVLITFLLFGPIAVSGTAMIQNHYQQIALTIPLYSMISGMLAVMAHLCIQFVRIKDDVRDGMTSLLSEGGCRRVRILYMMCVLTVCGIMIVFPQQVGLGHHWIAIVLSAVLLIASLYVYRLMGVDTMEAAILLRKIVIVQYVIMMFAMLCIVLYPMDFWVTLLGYPVEGNRYFIR